MFRHILLALLVAVASGQNVAPCRCGAFITLDTSEVMLYELPAIDVHNCDQNHNCMNRCSDEFFDLSGGGDLEFVASENGTLVGEILCQSAGAAVDNKIVYSYSEICDGPWEWTGEQALQPLCCDEDGIYFECGADGAY